MAKVLVERPRGGWRVPRRVGRPLAHEDHPLRESLSRGHTKWFGEHLGPLGKFLNKRVGRPWNKVFGEMRAHVKPGNTVQEHALSHIDQFILLEVDKVVPSIAAPLGIVRRSPDLRGLPIEEGMLYVDPDDGLIKRARRRLKGPPPARATKDQPPRRLADDRWALTRAGVWQGFRARPYKIVRMEGARPQFSLDGRLFDALDDAVHGRVRASDRNALAVLARTYGPGLIGQELGPLSHRDLKRHRLKNAAR